MRLMGAMGAITLLVAVLIAVYAHRLLHRLCVGLGGREDSRIVKIGTWLAAVAVALMSLNLFAFYGIVILHFLVIAVLVDSLDFLLKKFGGTRYKNCLLWQRLHTLGIVPAVITAAVMLGGYWNLHNVVQTSYTVPTQKEIRPQGYKAALIADVHFGVSLDYDELLEVTREISAQNPDIVILCGDIVDNDTTASGVREVFKALGSIENKNGIFYVYGNHDRLYGGIKSNYTEQELVEAIQSNGITILRDDTYRLAEDFVIVGREDRRYSDRAELRELLEGVSHESFILTLDHQPNEYAQNGELGTDLLLSGHTHGGQLWPMQYLFELGGFNDAVYGHLWIDEDTQAIVTSGFAGWKYPVKTAAPAEYVMIDIQQQNK